MARNEEEVNWEYGTIIDANVMREMREKRSLIFVTIINVNAALVIHFVCAELFYYLLLLEYRFALFIQFIQQ